MQGKVTNLEAHIMYRKLLPFVKKFVFVRQGAFNRYYEGKLLSVDSETLQIQSYKKDGSEEEVWTISLDTLSEFSVGGRHLAELSLKVSFMASEESIVHETTETMANENNLRQSALESAKDDLEA